MAAAYSRTISPVLADISQDIAGAVPLELILLWSTSDRSAKKHTELLEPHLRVGTVVSSDAAGLSKLSSEKTLLEVMKLVSQPKESIYGFGKAVGGNAIGMWVADNTQMFYEQSVQSEDIVDAMQQAQDEIQKESLVQVGMGIHHGTFIEIGGGLYGKDASFIEELAENRTEGGEIVVTEVFKKKLGKSFSTYFQQHSSSAKTFSLKDFSSQKNLTKHTETTYPHPFHQDFYEMLKKLDSLSSTEVEEKYNTFAKQAITIFLKIHHQPRRLLLEKLTDYIVANAYIQQTLKQFSQIQLVKSNGDLGIFIANDRNAAIEFSKVLFEKLQKNEFDLNIAMTQGEVLLFPLQNGFEIAGGPVNMASKLTEDSGEQNRILVEESVGLPEGNHQPFTFKISKVDINGVYLV